MVSKFTGAQAEHAPVVSIARHWMKAAASFKQLLFMAGQIKLSLFQQFIVKLGIHFRHRTKRFNLPLLVYFADTLLGIGQIRWINK